MRARAVASTVRAAVVLPWRAHRWMFGARLLITVAAGFAPVVAAWLLRSVLDLIANGHGAAGLGLLVIGLTAAMGLQVVLPYLAQYLGAQTGRILERHANEELFGAVSRLTGLARLEDPAYLDQLNVAQRVGMTGPGQLFTSLMGFAQSALTLSAFLVTLLVLNPVLTAVVLAATVPGVFAELGVARRRAAMVHGLSHPQRRQYFYASLLSSHEAAKEIRLFELGGFFKKRMLAELAEIHRASRRMDRREVVAYGLLAALSAVVSGVGVWWAASAAARGELTIGDVSIFVAALGSIGASLAVIIANAGVAYLAISTFRSYQYIVTDGPDLHDAPDPAPVRQLRHGVTFDDVWFRYGPDQPWALRGVSLFVPLGSAVALVGRNGAGKSTLVKLMCRFYDPDRGRILWDGTDLRELDLRQLRSRISAVFQDYMSYELSARENIEVGDLSHAGDEAATEAAARRGGIHEALVALPDGYDTLLTRTYLDLADRDDPRTGVLLSGGQWQRVALARAFLRGGRDLVILDEPSSGLDAEAEYVIHSRLRAHGHGRATVLISHRLNAIRDADKIVVLDDGQVVEEGDHASLTASSGVYARFFAMQSQGFADGALAEAD